MDRKINMIKKNISRSDRNSDIGRHLITMYGETILFNPKIIVELGVRKGLSTNILAEATSIVGGKLISVDNRDYSKSCDWDNWEFILGDSVETGKDFDKKVDILFIDTYHSKPQVMKELDAWIDHMNDRCQFIFHDTNPVWHKNIKIANEIGSVLDGINEFFNLKINKLGNHNSIYYDKQYQYYVSHYDYSEGMTYIRRIPC